MRELQRRRFPEKWRMAKSDAHKIYKVEPESGNRVLRARSEKQRIQIVLEHAFEPLAATPILWRMSHHKLLTFFDVGHKRESC